MSKGLGPLQREILATLPESAAPDVWHRGMALDKGSDEPWHCVRGLDVILADGIGDLIVARSIIVGRLGGCDSAGFSASFSRAVRTLVTRGEITLLSLVPITEYRDAPRAPRNRVNVCHFADGMYFDHGEQPARFTGPGDVTTKNRSWCSKVQVEADPGVAVVKVLEQYL